MSNGIYLPLPKTLVFLFDRETGFPCWEEQQSAILFTNEINAKEYVRKVVKGTAKDEYRGVSVETKTLGRNECRRLLPSWQKRGYENLCLIFGFDPHGRNIEKGIIALADWANELDRHRVKDEQIEEGQHRHHH